ncbi:MAG: hypothetical protein AVDCRST_MAG59-4395, partial [uncultured Thermomicrobiales bacterium]
DLSQLPDRQPTRQSVLHGVRDAVGDRGGSPHGHPLGGRGADRACFGRGRSGFLADDRAPAPTWWRRLRRAPAECGRWCGDAAGQPRGVAGDPSRMADVFGGTAAGTAASAVGRLARRGARGVFVAVRRAGGLVQHDRARYARCRGNAGSDRGDAPGARPM